MLFKVQFKTLKKVSFIALKKSFGVKQLFFGVINLFAISWITTIFLSLVHLDNNLLKMVLTMAIFLLIPKKYAEKIKYFFLILVILRFMVDNSIYSLEFITNFILLFVVLFLFRGFLENEANSLGQELFSEEIKVSQLKPGMILSKIIVQKDKGELDYLKKENTEIVYYKGSYYIQQAKSFLNLKDFVGEEPEGLTKKQIILIKEMGFKKINVSKTISFASLMFAGVLLTLILKGNFISFLKGIL